MNEVELAKPVINWLADQHWEVYQEVQYGYAGRVADISLNGTILFGLLKPKHRMGLQFLNKLRVGLFTIDQ